MEGLSKTRKCQLPESRKQEVIFFFLVLKTPEVNGHESESRSVVSDSL